MTLGLVEGVSRSVSEGFRLGLGEGVRRSIGEGVRLGAGEGFTVGEGKGLWLDVGDFVSPSVVECFRLSVGVGQRCPWRQRQFIFHRRHGAARQRQRQFIFYYRRGAAASASKKRKF